MIALAVAILAGAWAANKRAASVGVEGGSMLAGKKADWLRNLAQVARPICAEYRVPLAVCLAQAAIESAWGSRMPDNPFGLRGVGDAGSHSITTKESAGKGDGSTVTMTGQQFRKFSSLTAAVTAYCRWFNGNRSMRPAVRPLSGDPAAFIVWAWGVATYATADGYPVAIRNVSRTVAKTLGDDALRIVLDGKAWAAYQAGKGAKPGKARAAAVKTQLAVAYGVPLAEYEAAAGEVGSDVVQLDVMTADVLEWYGAGEVA